MSPLGRAARGPSGSGLRVPVASVRGLSRADIGPEGLDLVGTEHVVPRRHVAFAVAHRINKTRVGVARKLAKVDCPLWIAHARAVAGPTVASKQGRACLDLLRRELDLIARLRGIHAHGNTEPCIRKNLHAALSERVTRASAQMSTPSRRWARGRQPS